MPDRVRLSGSRAAPGALLATLEELLAVPVASLRGALDRSTALIAEVFEVDKVDAWLFDPAANTLNATGVSDTPLGRLQQQLGLDRLPLDQESQVREVFLSGEPRLVNRIDLDPRTHPRMRDELGVRSVIAAAFEVDQDRRGVLMLADQQPDRFTPEELAFLTIVARWIGVVAHRAELAERERDERLSAALSASGMGLWELDLSSLSLTSSVTCRANYGLSAEEPLTLDGLRELILPEDRATQKAAFERAIAEGVEYVGEYRVRRPDGQVRWIASRGQPAFSRSGQPVRMLGVTQDITERAEVRLAAERALDRLARLQSVTAALAAATGRNELAKLALEHAVAALDAAAGSIYTYVSGVDGDELSLVAETGYPEGEATLYARLSRDQPVPLVQAARSGLPVWLESCQQWHEQFPTSGDVHAALGFEAAAAIPLVARGRTVGALGLSFVGAREFAREDQDLMLAVAGQSAVALERAELYESERAARAEAESAVRARDEFLSIASHELRNPLATLKGRLDLLLRQLRRGQVAPDEVPKNLEPVVGAAGRLGRLLDDLLDVSRLRTGQLQIAPAEMDLLAVARESVERAALSSPEHDIELVLESPASVVQGDRDRLEQVLANLLENAIKYSPQGGAVSVRLSEQDGGVLVQVRDRGIGLPPGSEETIFQPFGRATNASERHIPGMGLGLYVSRQIASAHGGRLWASSDGQGQGATFSLWLPRSGIASTP